MNFTNINDPAGVKALLDQLRSSQAWQEVVHPPQDTTPTSSSTSREPLTQGESSGGQPSSPSSSVASLLSQLQPSASWPPHPPSNPPSFEFQRSSSSVSTIDPVLPQPSPSPSHVRKPVIKGYTFQQALPRLAQLSDDPTFVVSISQLMKEQDDLERQLWAERRAIQKKYEEKVKVAKTKANMIGSLSRHEANTISDAFKRELYKFDCERALPAWDRLISNQQSMMALRGVPTMFTTDVAADQERQLQVIQVLEGIAGR